jgi:hypothetical protein
MDIVHAGRMDWGENLASHRSGGMSHKVLFEGVEGDPDNYLLVLANERSDYYSPRHRHAWDQVRFCLQGWLPLAKDLTLEAGEVAYFPEGVPYGPHDGGSDRIVLLLQFGGASGQGYLSARQLRAAHQDLLQQGVFEGGVFRRSSGDGKKNLDAYEALWRHATGRPIDYPKPRYKAPVVLRPDAFPWKQDGGLRRKRLASFPERGVSLDLFGLEPGGEWRADKEDSLRLIFVREGRGAASDEPYEPMTALRLPPGQGLSVRADERTELFVISVEPLSFA